MSTKHHHFSWKKFLTSPAGMVMCCFLMIGGLFLTIKHLDHLGPYWPWLIFAACPLMHLFMHKNHKHEGKGGEANGHDHHHDSGKGEHDHGR